MLSQLSGLLRTRARHAAVRDSQSTRWLAARSASATCCGGCLLRCEAQEWVRTPLHRDPHGALRLVALIQLRKHSACLSLGRQRGRAQGRRLLRQRTFVNSVRKRSASSSGIAAARQRRVGKEWGGAGDGGFIRYKCTRARTNAWLVACRCLVVEKLRNERAVRKKICV